MTRTSNAVQLRRADLDAVLAIEAAVVQQPDDARVVRERTADARTCASCSSSARARVPSPASARSGGRSIRFTSTISPSRRPAPAGLGRPLLAARSGGGRADGRAARTLEVRRSNMAARRLYEGAGFKLTGVRPSYYTHPIEDALILSRGGPCNDLATPRRGGRVRLGAGCISHPTPEGRRNTMAEAQDLKHLLLETNEEYRQLATKHHELDDRLHELILEALPVRCRTIRRSHPEKTQAPAQGPDGGYRAFAATFLAARHLDRDLNSARREPWPYPDFRAGSVGTRRHLHRAAGRMSSYHRTSMGIDRAGWPFILGALVVALAGVWWFGRLWALPFLVLAAFFVFFFRDPDRQIPDRSRPRGLRRPTGG